MTAEWCRIDLTIYGDGAQTRSFCFVSDLIEGMCRLMKVDYKQPVNLGNPAEFKVSELAEMVIRLLGSKSKIKYENLPTDDPKRRRPDISVAKKILDWQPVVPLEEGIKKTSEWFSGQLKVNK